MKLNFNLICAAFALCVFVAFALRGPIALKTNMSQKEQFSEDASDSTPLAANSIPAVQSDDSLIEPTAYEVENPKGRILIVRGIMTVFSLGLNDLGEKFQQLGYDVHVTPAVKSSYAADGICKKMQEANDGLPLIVIGHSLGGDLAPDLSRLFGKKNIPVDLVVMLDSTHPTAPPANVRRCINLYQADKKTLFKGASIRANQRATEIFNINIRQIAQTDTTSKIDHFNIDENPWIHQLIITAVESNHEIRSPNDLTQRVQYTQIVESDSKTKTKKPSSWFNRMKRR